MVTPFDYGSTYSGTPSYTPFTSSRRNYSVQDLRSIRDRREAGRIAETALAQMPSTRPRLDSSQGSVGGPTRTGTPAVPIPSTRDGSFFGGNVLKNVWDAASTPLIPEDSFITDIPIFGNAIRSVSTPLDLGIMAATAGIGGSGLIAGKLAGQGIAKAGARMLTAPIVQGNIGTRLAAEAGVSVVGAKGAEEGSERWGLAGGIVGGIGAGILTAGGVGLAANKFRRGLPDPETGLRPGEVEYVDRDGKTHRVFVNQAIKDFKMSDEEQSFFIRPLEDDEIIGAVQRWKDWQLEGKSSDPHTVGPLGFASVLGQGRELDMNSALDKEWFAYTVRGQQADSIVQRMTANIKMTRPDSDVNELGEWVTRSLKERTPVPFDPEVVKPRGIMAGEDPTITDRVVYKHLFDDEGNPIKFKMDLEESRIFYGENRPATWGKLNLDWEDEVPERGFEAKKRRYRVKSKNPRTGKITTRYINVMGRKETEDSILQHMTELEAEEAFFPPSEFGERAQNAAEALKTANQQQWVRGRIGAVAPAAAGRGAALTFRQLGTLSSQERKNIVDILGGNYEAFDRWTVAEIHSKLLEAARNLDEDAAILNGRYRGKYWAEEMTDPIPGRGAYSRTETRIVPNKKGPKPTDAVDGEKERAWQEATENGWTRDGKWRIVEDTESVQAREQLRGMSAPYSVIENRQAVGSTPVVGHEGYQGEARRNRRIFTIYDADGNAVYTLDATLREPDFGPRPRQVGEPITAAYARVNEDSFTPEQLRNADLGGKVKADGTLDVQPIDIARRRRGYTLARDGSRYTQSPIGHYFREREDLRQGIDKAFREPGMGGEATSARMREVDEEELMLDAQGRPLKSRRRPEGGVYDEPVDPNAPEPGKRPQDLYHEYDSDYDPDYDSFDAPDYDPDVDDFDADFDADFDDWPGADEFDFDDGFGAGESSRFGADAPTQEGIRALDLRRELESLLSLQSENLDPRDMGLAGMDISPEQFMFPHEQYTRKWLAELAPKIKATSARIRLEKDLDQWQREWVGNLSRKDAEGNPLPPVQTMTEGLRDRARELGLTDDQVKDITTETFARLDKQFGSEGLGRRIGEFDDLLRQIGEPLDAKGNVEGYDPRWEMSEPGTSGRYGDDPEDIFKSGIWEIGFKRHVDSGNVEGTYSFGALADPDNALRDSKGNILKIGKNSHIGWYEQLLRQLDAEEVWGHRVTGRAVKGIPPEEAASGYIHTQIEGVTRKALEEAWEAKGRPIIAKRGTKKVGNPRGTNEPGFDDSGFKAQGGPTRPSYMPTRDTETTTIPAVRGQSARSEGIKATEGWREGPTVLRKETDFEYEERVPRPPEYEVGEGSGRTWADRENVRHFEGDDLEIIPGDKSAEGGTGVSAALTPEQQAAVGRRLSSVRATAMYNQAVDALKSGGKYSPPPGVSDEWREETLFDWFMGMVDNGITEADARLLYPGDPTRPGTWSPLSRQELAGRPDLEGRIETKEGKNKGRNVEDLPFSQLASEFFEGGLKPGQIWQNDGSIRIEDLAEAGTALPLGVNAPPSFKVKSFGPDLSMNLVDLGNGQFYNPTTRRIHSEADARFISNFHQLIDQAGRYAESQGVEIHHLDFATGARYTPRAVLNMFFEGYRSQRNTGGGVGSPESFQYPRYHENMADAIARGVDYENNPDFLLEAHLRSMLVATRTAQLTNGLIGSGAIKLTKSGYDKFTDTIDTLYSDKTLRGVKASRLAELYEVNEDFANELLDITDAYEAGRPAVGSYKYKAGEGYGPKERGPASEDTWQEYRSSLTALRTKLREWKGTLKVVDDGHGNADPLFAGNFFDPAVAKELKKWTAKPGGFTRGAAEFGDLARTTSTTVDLSAPFIQGLPLLARDPAKWGEGWLKAIKAMRDPEYFSRYIAKNEHHLREFGQLVVGGSSEHYAGLQRTGLLFKGLRKLDKVGPEEFKAGTAIGNKLAGFERAFTFFGTFARIEMAKGLAPMARQKMASDNLRIVNMLTELTLKQAEANQLQPSLPADFGADMKWLNNIDPALAKLVNEGKLGTALEMAQRGEVRAAAMEEMQSMVNKMTGVFSPGDLVLTDKQEHFERGYLFFAPRYTRATLAAAGQLFKSDIQGEIARDTLTKLAVGGTIAYVTFAEALGQEPHLDPSKGDFMTLNINGDRIGVGGAWTSLTRLIGNIATDPGLLGNEWGKGEKFNLSNSKLLFQSDAPGQSELSPTQMGQNPLIKFFRGKSSVITGNMWDIATGSDYVGREIEATFPSIANHVGKATLPFALEGAILGSPERNEPSTFGFEFLGARGYPKSSYDNQKELQNRLAGQIYNTPWKELSVLQQTRIKNGSEKLQELTKIARKHRVDRGQSVDADVQDFFDEREAAKNEWGGKLKLASDAWQAGRLDLYDLRKDILPSANNDRNAVYESIDSNSKYNNVRQWLEYQDTRPGKHPDRPEDIAYDAYISSIVLNEQFENELGQRDWEAVAAAEQDFRVEYGDETYAYVRTRMEEGKGLPDIVKELLGGREKYQWYWGGPNINGSIASQVISARSDADRSKIWYEEYQNAGREEQYWLEEDEGPKGQTIRAINRVVSRVKKRVRELDYDLDLFLFRWGYVERPVNEGLKYDGAIQDMLEGQPMKRYMLAPGNPMQQQEADTLETAASF